MKIIDLGICIDNQDPKGVGRIRCVRYSDSVSDKENALKYEPYSKNDVFVVNPFLPITINHIPDVGQAVKLLSYDTDSETINQEYVSGPFNDLIDIKNQVFSSQVENTTYGNMNKEKKDVFDSEGNYRNKNSEGFHHKKNDSGFYGKLGSDLIFTDNGLILRGGKLKDKSKLSTKERKNYLDLPLMSKNVPRIIIKKFNNKLSTEEVENEEITVDISPIKLLIEYDIDSFDNPTEIKFFVYRNNTTKPQYNSNNFKLTTQRGGSDFVNLSKSDDGVFYVIPVTDPNFIYCEINNFLYNIHTGQTKDILQEDYNFEYPIYFRPTQRTLTTRTNSPNKQTTLNKVEFFGVGPMSGLVWSKESLTPEQSSSIVKSNVLRSDDTLEESFTSLISDKIFLLSSDTNNTEKSIDFNKLDTYDLSHEDYKKEIQPNTYSLVRGENLIKIIKSLVNVVLTHQHNVVGPMVQNENYGEYVELMEYVKKMEDDILNQSIKIN